MIHIIREPHPNGTFLDLSGRVEEHTDFESLIGPISGLVTIRCSGIQRFNSVGVKSWISYFEKLRRRGVDVTFVECSVPFMEQVGLLSSFLAGGTIQSLHVPFTCEVDSTEFTSVFSVRELEQSDFIVPDQPCPECKRANSAIFDDLREDYFSHWLARKH